MRATITVCPEGINAGFAGGNNCPKERGEIKGWSVGSAKRNMDFLKSIYIPDLDGVALAITLTVKEIPHSHHEWSYLQKQLLQQLRKWSLVRAHWVTEWTKRNVPHLHITAFFDPDYIEECPNIAINIEQYWLKITRHLKTLPRGQHVAMMDADAGWFQYVSKHASRGHAHYQREKGNIPKTWHKTGKLWGKSGEWPIVKETFMVDRKTFWRLRRKIKNWLRVTAQAELVRAQGMRNGKRRDSSIKTAKRRISYLNQSLKRNERKISEVRGINEWIPFDVIEGFISELAEFDGAIIEVPETQEEKEIRETVNLPDYRDNSKYNGRYDTPETQLRKKRKFQREHDAVWSQ